MKAVLLEGFGGVEVLQVGEVDRPVPGENQVLVKVMATSINRPDLVQREGKYPPPPGDSEILGLEVSGVIEEVGPGVVGWQKGERVISLVGGGGYAEYAVAYANHLMRIPDSMSFEEAACVCESYITAFLNIFMIGEFKDGQTAILHGGGGGVNTAGIQLCRALAPSSKLIVTAHPSKMERVKECLQAHDCDLSGSVFDDVNMSGATIENVNLSGCTLHNVNVSGASFDDANLSGWRVQNVNLAGLKIVQANLAGASISKGRMEGMTIDGILVSDLLAAYRAQNPPENSK